MEYRDSASLHNYEQFVRTLHIGLAPLQPTEFNQGRSDIKFVEYAAAGVAAICSALEPYTATVRPGVDGLLFTNLEELRVHLDSLITQPELRQRIA